MAWAIISGGEIRPIEPLPADWAERQVLWIERAETSPESPEDIDQDFARLEALCAQGDPDDDDRLDAALREAKDRAKEQVRRQMGLE